MIDFLLYDRGLTARARPLLPLRPDSVLPGPGFPSDHIPLKADLEWAT